MGSAATRPITVLVADDDVAVRGALGQLVAQDDALRLVESVADGYSAGAAAARHRPAVAVVDVQMPFGGVDAVRAIKEASQETAVIVYTARGDDVTEREMRAAGACHLVVKGDRSEGIVAAIVVAAGSDFGDRGSAPAGPQGESGHNPGAPAV